MEFTAEITYLHARKKNWLLFIFFNCIFAIVFSMHAIAEETNASKAENTVKQLDKPLYTAFTERYILDELKQLRIDMATQRVDIIQQMTDRQLDTIDKNVNYATNTVSNFFYIIAAASAVLVILGWTSIRDMKEKMTNLADKELRKLIVDYEDRLHDIEQQLRQKSEFIDANRDEILLTKEIHSLWLKAAQENLPANKISIYDQILALNPNDCQALTYKADAALEANEPQWAINLCQKALLLDSTNAHAFYQLACAHTALLRYDEAIIFLTKALLNGDARLDDFANDVALKPLHHIPEFQQLLKNKNK